MWSRYIDNFQTVLDVINKSLSECPAWPVIKDPLFVVVFMIIFSVLILRRSYKAMVALISGLVLIVVCQSTLIDVVIPDCFGNKLPIFVVGFITVAAFNVYFLLIRD